MSLVTPSFLFSVVARPEAPHGNLATFTFIFFSFASVSVSPHQAISGSVNTTAGMALGSKTLFFPASTCATTRPSCVALWANIGSPATSPIANILGSDVLLCPSISIKPFLSILTFVFSNPSFSELGLRPTDTSTLSNISSSFSISSPSNLTCKPFLVSSMSTTLVLSIIDS